MDYWSYKSYKATVTSSPPTNQHPVFYRPDALPVANQQCKSTEGKFHYGVLMHINIFGIAGVYISYSPAIFVDIWIFSREHINLLIKNTRDNMSW